MAPLRIDFHTHILPKHWPDLEKKYGYGGFVSLEHEPGAAPDRPARMMLNGKLFRAVECNCWSSSARLADCADTSVDVQVLSTVPVMFNYWAKPEDTLDLARYLNDHIAHTCAEDPTRFVGLATLPMQAPALAVEELRRCVSELGLKGVQIGTHINDWNLDAPELDVFWAAAEDMQVPIFIHPWDMETGPRWKDYWFPWLIGMPCETTMAICSLIFGGVLERFPRLKVCFAHGGGSFPGTLGRILHGWAVRPDLCAMSCKDSPLSYIHRLWMDSLVHDDATLRFLVEKMGGSSKIVLGSDYPFPLGEHKPGQIVDEASWLSDEAKAGILGGNALELLGMTEEDFRPSLSTIPRDSPSEVKTPGPKEAIPHPSDPEPTTITELA